MPQVAARISSDHEKWLKDYFKTKSAGAEFIQHRVIDENRNARLALLRDDGAAFAF